MTEPPNRHYILEKVGLTLFGERWISPLARGMGVDHTLIVRVVKGERTFTALQQQQLEAFLVAEWKRHHDEAKLIESLIVEVTGQPLAEQLHLLPAVDDEPQTNLE